jgi:hypothetical protein
VDKGKPGTVEILTDYATIYAANAAFNQVWEEVCQTDPTLAAVRRDLTRSIEAGVEDAQHRAVWTKVTPRLSDPAATARALCAQADRFCYLIYVFDPADPPMDPAKAGRVLVQLRSGAIRLPD